MDVDGTLLNDEKKIPESACQAIKEIKKAGNLCLLCTGRNLDQIRMFDFLELDGAVLLNGSVVILNDKVIFERAFPDKIVTELFEYAEEVGAGLHVLTLNNIYSNDSWNKRKISFLKAGFDLSEEAFRKRARFDTPLKLFEGETVYKIDVRFPSPGHRQKYYENLDPSLNMFIDSGYYSRGGTWYAELNHCEASKGIAVFHLLHKLREGFHLRLRMVVNAAMLAREIALVGNEEDALKGVLLAEETRTDEPIWEIEKLSDARHIWG